MRNKKRLKLADVRGPAARRPLEDLVAVRIARLADVMARLAEQYVTSQVGAHGSDLRLLNLLDATEGITVNEIARRIHIDKGWVSRSLQRLEESGLVSRSSSRSDARVSVVHLSPRGRAALDRIKPTTFAREQRLLDGIEEERFKAELDRLMANAEALLASGSAQ